MTTLPAIVIDTREQTPYEFSHPSEVATLRTGDYSLKGYETRVCIERKSKPDAYSTIGKGRARFIRELERMTEFDYAAIVIESTLSGLLTPPPYSQKMSPKRVVSSLLSWSVRYGVHVFFADDRAHARALTQKLLQKYGERVCQKRSTGKGSSNRSSTTGDSGSSTNP